MQAIKLVVVGDQSVGKSCLFITSQTGLFPLEFVPKITDGCSKELVVDNHSYTVHFWDTASQKEYAMIRTISYPNTDVFLVCFDVTNRSSFENIEHQWVPELRHNAPDSAIIILVGTKIDLRSNADKHNRSPQSCVTYEEGRQLATRLGITTYLECSALTHDGVDAVIHTAVRTAVRENPSKKESDKFLVEGDSASSEAWTPVTPSTENEVEDIKLMVAGDNTVGKTCLLITHQTGSFPSECVPVVSDDYFQGISIDNRAYNVGLWDTAGQEDYDRLRPLAYPATDAFLVCFDVSNRSSFENIEHKWLPELRHYAPDSAIILVGTKTDLRSNADEDNRSSDDYVTYDEGRQLAARLGISTYLECSSLIHEGIDIVFYTAVRKAVCKKTSKESVKEGWRGRTSLTKV